MTTESVGHTKATGWEPGGLHVQDALRSLTKAERRYVEAGYIGDVTPGVLRSLREKAMFYLQIDSPNGRCGSMRLTPLGVNVRALILARATGATSHAE